MRKYLIKNFGELNSSIQLLTKMFVLLKHSKENMPITSFLEQMNGVWCLSDLLGESLDASMDELTGHDHDNLVYDYEKFTEEFVSYCKETEIYNQLLK